MQQSYSVAKKVFEQIPAKTIKFVLIGLSPYRDGKFLTENDVKEMTPVLQDYFKLCVANDARPVCLLFPVEWSQRKTCNSDVLKRFRQAINATGKKYKFVFVDFLDTKIAGSCFQQDKCNLNSTGAATISALLSERLYLKGLVSAEKMYSMDKSYFDLLSKNFSDDYKTLVAHIFCKMACADFMRLSEILPQDECKNLMANAFSSMTYYYLKKLSDMLPKDDYNDLADRIFKISVEKIRHKSKIKVGIHFAYSAFWFGDDLYNLFASNERFELKLFVNTKSGNKAVNAERSLDAARFKSHGINIFDLGDKTLNIPEQDILFCLTPYQSSIPVPFRIINLKLTTLLINIPYTFSVCDRGGLLGLGICSCFVENVRFFHNIVRFMQKKIQSRYASRTLWRLSENGRIL